VPDKSIIGWDVGGAHLKAARLGPAGEVERVVQVPCPLWQGLVPLDAAVETARLAVGDAPVHALTMTGEMVDFFPDREEGVRQLIAALQRHLGSGALQFYAGAGGFVAGPAAAAAARSLASANWRATADVVAAARGTALLVDIGSTTTDLVVVSAGQVMARGQDDAARLLAGELLYTGVVRTPLMAVAPRAPFEGEWVPLMAEYFATTADVYRLSGQLPEGADQHPAADGGEKTPAASARRLARMLGRDVESAPFQGWRQLAEWFARAQVRQIEDAFDRVVSRPVVPADAPIVSAGVGRFLMPDVATARGRECHEFADLFPGSPAARAGISDCAPAVAVAALARRGG
jgi:probable H4MPT-linked C1 transfer pathway protein